MPHYIVFSGGRAGRGPMVWDEAPVGVFEAPSPANACQAAARKTGTMGTYFAVEGLPWGVEMLDAGDAHEIGGDELEEARRELRELQRRVGAGDEI